LGETFEKEKRKGENTYKRKTKKEERTETMGSKRVN
jgi:hypothetical protein